MSQADAHSTAFNDSAQAAHAVVFRTLRIIHPRWPIPGPPASMKVDLDKAAWWQLGVLIGHMCATSPNLTQEQMTDETFAVAVAWSNQQLAARPKQQETSHAHTPA